MVTKYMRHTIATLICALSCLSVSAAGLVGGTISPNSGGSTVVGTNGGTSWNQTLVNPIILQLTNDFTIIPAYFPTVFTVQNNQDSGYSGNYSNVYNNGDWSVWRGPNSHFLSRNDPTVAANVSSLGQTNVWSLGPSNDVGLASIYFALTGPLESPSSEWLDVNLAWLPSLFSFDASKLPQTNLTGIAWIAVNGDDTWPGTKLLPFRKFNRAVELGFTNFNFGPGIFWVTAPNLTNVTVTGSGMQNTILRPNDGLSAGVITVCGNSTVQDIASYGQYAIGSVMTNETVVFKNFAGSMDKTSIDGLTGSLVNGGTVIWDGCVKYGSYDIENFQNDKNGRFYYVNEIREIRGKGGPSAPVHGFMPANVGSATNNTYFISGGMFSISNTAAGITGNTNAMFLFGPNTQSNTIYVSGTILDLKRCPSATLIYDAGVGNRVIFTNIIQ